MSDPLTPPPVDPDLAGQEPDEQPEEEPNTTGDPDGNVEADSASGGAPER